MKYILDEIITGLAMGITLGTLFFLALFGA